MSALGGRTQPGRASVRPTVFLTGVPRSGTTWVGRVLTADPSVFSVFEPFNPKSRETMLLRYPSAHLEPEAPIVISEQLRRSVAELLALRLHLPRGIDVRRPKRAVRELATIPRLLAAKARHSPMVIKDPTANHLTAWLHREFGMRPAVLVRHPCGNAAGYLRMGWSGVNYGPGRLAQLSAADRDHVEHHGERAKGNPVLSAAIDWRATNNMLLQLRETIPELVVVRYEDLATTSDTAFPALAAQLGLPWGQRSEAVLDELRGPALEEATLGSKLHVMKRDARAAADSWRSRLSAVEIEAVMEHAGPLAQELGYER